MSAIVTEVTASVKLASRGSISAAADAMPMPTKANSPPGPSSKPVSTATGHDRWKILARQISSTDLMTIRLDDAAGEQQRIAQQLAHVDIHADGEEENAEQQPLERLDGGFDRLAVFGLGEQQAGDEGAERHGQAGLIGNDAGGDDDEQNDGDEQLGGTRVRHQPEQRPQQHAAEDDDDGNGNHGLKQRSAETFEHRTAGTRGQDRDEHQDRNDGEILGEQDGKAGAADGRGETLLVRQQFEHDRRRRQRQARAEDHRFRGRLAEQQRDAGKQRRGQQHLQAAKAEHQPPHRQEAMQRQFETDQEQQEDDAELGNAVDIPGVADGEPEQRRIFLIESAEPERPEQRAGAEIAEHRTEAEAAHHRHHDARRAEHDQRIAVIADVDGRRGQQQYIITIAASVRENCGFKMLSGLKMLDAKIPNASSVVSLRACTMANIKTTLIIASARRLRIF